MISNLVCGLNSFNYGDKGFWPPNTRTRKVYQKTTMLTDRHFVLNLCRMDKCSVQRPYFIHRARQTTGILDFEHERA